MANRDIVVIGGSSGAAEPLGAILGALPSDLPAAIFVVLHTRAQDRGVLATVARAAGALPVHVASDGLEIERGTIYSAVPSHHLLIEDAHMLLGNGPRENMARPAIDALFRSAAVAYGPRVIGIVLSGYLNDGAAGLAAIKRCGGVALVQDPAEATAEEMPRNALHATDVDMVATGSGLGDVLPGLVQATAGPVLPVPADIRLEVEIAAGRRIDTDAFRQVAAPVALTCPQCGGVLSQIEASQPLRFRCQVGHAVTAEVLASEQENAVDEAMRIALRIVGERAELVQRMADDARTAGRVRTAQTYLERAEELRHHAETIRRAVLSTIPPKDKGKSVESK